MTGNRTPGPPHSPFRTLEDTGPAGRLHATHLALARRWRGRSDCPTGSVGQGVEVVAGPFDATAAAPRNAATVEMQHRTVISGTAASRDLAGPRRTRCRTSAVRTNCPAQHPSSARTRMRAACGLAGVGRLAPIDPRAGRGSAPAEPDGPPFTARHVYNMVRGDTLALIAPMPCAISVAEGRSPPVQWPSSQRTGSRRGVAGPVRSNVTTSRHNGHQCGESVGRCASLCGGSCGYGRATGFSLQR